MAWLAWEEDSWMLGKMLDDLDDVEKQAKKEDIQRQPHFRLVVIGGTHWCTGGGGVYQYGAGLCKLYYDPVDYEELGLLRWLVSHCDV